VGGKRHRSRRPEKDMSLCDYCGIRLVWGTTPEGTRVPLDPRAPVYRFDGETALLIPMDDSGVRAYMVNHYSTCPKVTRKGQTRLPLGPGGQPVKTP
jgi:hypothetical protein